MSYATAHTKRDRAFELRGKAVVYKTPPATEPNLKTGAVNNGQSVSSLTIDYVLVGYATDEDVQNSKGRYNRTDRVFRIRAADMPATPPPNGVLIVYNSITYRVIGHRSDPSDYVYDHFARQV